MADNNENTLQKDVSKLQSGSNMMINIQPCTPSQQILEEPIFPTRSGSNISQVSSTSTTSLVQDGKLEKSNSRTSPFTKRKFFSKTSSTSFHTSLELTDEEGTTHPESFDDHSNASLSDSLTQSSFREKKHDEDKKRKKKNRISKIISGVGPKSKAELFQKLFKDMSGEEKLIVDYSCALYRDILVHGRMYLSQNWVCFYANIFGWETLVTIPIEEITAITKEKTAKVIPNAIQVLTESDKYFFTTFVTRDNAYTAMFRIWQNALMDHEKGTSQDVNVKNQPMNPGELKAICKKYRQKKSSFGDTVDGDPIHDEHDETGDELHEEEDTTMNSLSVSQENLNHTTDPENDKLENGGTHTNDQDAEILRTASMSSTKSENGAISRDTKTQNGKDNHQNGELSKKKSSSMTHLPPGNSHQPTKDEHRSLRDNIKHGFHRPISSPFKQAHDLFRKKKKKKVQRAKHPSYHLAIPNREEGETTTDFDSDESVDELEDGDEDVLCPCSEHIGKLYIDEEFNFDTDTLYDHLFNQDSDMMKRVFQQRTFLNWKYSAYEKHVDGYYTQTLSYTLPLNYSIGPKESFTISKQMMSPANRPGHCIVVDVENTSQGVPYSDSFVVNIRYCMTRTIGNRSRLKVYGELKYTKRVFGLVKNMITKSSDEACRDYFGFLITILKSESELVPPSAVKPSKRKAEKKKTNETPTAAPTPATSAVNARKESIKESAASTISNFQLSTTTLIGFLLTVLLLMSMNMYLMSRITALEGTVLIQKDTWLPKEIPTNDNEWTKLLDYQKGLHDLELLKLKEVIGSTALLVQQIEKSISGLHEELDRSLTKNRLPSNSDKEEL